MLPMVVATAWLVVLPTFAGWKVERVMLGFAVAELGALASSVVMTLVSVAVAVDVAVAAAVAAAAAAAVDVLAATVRLAVVAEPLVVERLRLVVAVLGTTIAIAATEVVEQRDVLGPRQPFSVPPDELIETDLQGRFVMGQGKESAA